MKYYITIDNSIIKPKIKYYKTRKKAEKDTTFLYDILIKGKIIKGEWMIKK